MEVFFELISQFDPVMQEHLQRIQAKELCDAYLSKHIHNELITILEKCWELENQILLCHHGLHNRF